MHTYYFIDSAFDYFTSHRLSFLLCMKGARNYFIDSIFTIFLRYKFISLYSFADMLKQARGNVYKNFPYYRSYALILPICYIPLCRPYKFPLQTLRLYLVFLHCFTQVFYQSPQKTTRLRIKNNTLSAPLHARQAERALPITFTASRKFLHARPERLTNAP